MGVKAICDIDIGVPQGSALGPLLFKLCCNFGEGHGVLRCTAPPVRLWHLPLHLRSKEELTTAIETIERCADALYNWLSHNGLALNPSKLKVIQFSISQARYTNNVATINVAGAPTALSPYIKSLGVTLDSHLTFDDHVTAVSKACYFHIRALRHIRASIPDNVAKMIACSIVGSRLDYCNSLLAGMSEANFTKLQCVQNILAHVLTGYRRYECVKQESYTSLLF